MASQEQRVAKNLANNFMRETKHVYVAGQKAVALVWTAEVPEDLEDVLYSCGLPNSWYVKSQSQNSEGVLILVAKGEPNYDE